MSALALAAPPAQGTRVAMLLVPAGPDAQRALAIPDGAAVLAERGTRPDRLDLYLSTDGEHYATRAASAYERLHEGAPAIARPAVPAANLVLVGVWDPTTQVVQPNGAKGREQLAAWLGLTDADAHAWQLLRELRCAPSPRPSRARGLLHRSRRRGRS